jgi:hypothetical protein
MRPFAFNKLAVEIVELDDIARVFVVPCGSASGPAGSRGLTISRLAGLREITDRE